MTITRLATIVLAASAALMPLAAEAACTVNTTNVAFGAYNVFTATPDDATGRVRLRCTGTRPPSVTVHLDKGGALERVVFCVFGDEARRAFEGALALAGG